MLADSRGMPKSERVRRELRGAGLKPLLRLDCLQVTSCRAQLDAEILRGCRNADDVIDAHGMQGATFRGTRHGVLHGPSVVRMQASRRSQHSFDL